MLVHVLRATGYLLEQNVCAGAYPLSADAAVAVRPLHVAADGNDSCARPGTARMENRRRVYILMLGYCRSE